MGAMTDNYSADRATFLAIYLNDHLLGATAGVELARRLADIQAGAEYADDVARLAEDIEEDRASLIRIMKQLRVAVNPVKVASGWMGEKLARLKRNGRWLRRSPLSSLLELEAMSLGVEGKAAGWHSLRAVADRDDRLDPAEFERLIQRADRQRDLLEQLRVVTASQRRTERSSLLGSPSRAVSTHGMVERSQGG
jgi:hypothetical protein